MNTILLIAERSGTAGHRLLDSVKSAVKAGIPGSEVAYDELKKRYVRMKGKTNEQTETNPPPEMKKTDAALTSKNDLNG